jgi:hypothetical protein
MKKTIMAFAFAVTASLAFAQTETVKTVTTQTVTTTNVVDADNDQKITPAEFQASIEVKTRLAAWDMDSDGKVSFDEFTKGTFKAWDKDKNGEIILSEFNQDLPYWYVSVAKAETFAAWDRNSDGEIHLDEFRDGIRKTGLSLSFYQDINQSLPVADFQQRVYSFWDTDRDGIVTVKEYNNSNGHWIIVSGDGKS